MTCIAVRKYKKYISLCGDTEMSEGGIFKQDISENKEFKRSSKLWQIGDICFGGAGRMADSLLFKEFCKTNLPKGDRIDDMESFILKFYDECKKKNGSRTAFNAFIIVYSGKIFYVDEYLIVEVEEYQSIGSGRPTARTCLYLGMSAKEAVDVARKLSAGVGGITQEIKIPL